jgi:hypothetical protein
MKNFSSLQKILKDYPIEIQLNPSLTERELSFNFKKNSLELSFPFDSDKLTHEIGHIAEIPEPRLLLPNLGFGAFFDEKPYPPAKKLGAVLREMKVLCYERNIGKALNLDLKVNSDEITIFGVWGLIDEFPFPDKHLIPGDNKLDQELWVQQKMSEYLKEYTFDHFMFNWNKKREFITSKSYLEE